MSMAFASVLMACFMFAAQSAKADEILFQDSLGDSATLTGSTRLSDPNSGISTVLCPPGGDICTATLFAPAGFTTALGVITYYLGEGSTTGNISDDFIAALGSVAAVLKFDSDLATVAGETTNLGPCPAVVGCNAPENGLPQLVGTITWTQTGMAPVIDNLYIQSEAPAVVPEPGSLILFGSGLAMAGWLLRRRQRLVMPSV
jgi:hypothetical protein